MVVVGFLSSLAVFWRLFFLMFRQSLLSSEDAGHRDWQNVRKNNLQKTTKEPEKPTTTIRSRSWKPSWIHSGKCLFPVIARFPPLKHSLFLKCISQQRDLQLKLLYLHASVLMCFHNLTFLPFERALLLDKGSVSPCLISPKDVKVELEQTVGKQNPGRLMEFLGDIFAFTGTSTVSLVHFWFCCFSYSKWQI